MTRNAEFDAHGRPSNERDGACICDYNPSTTDGPNECCPFHGRPYDYWIARGDVLLRLNEAALAKVSRVEALADEWASDPVGGDLWRSEAVDALRAALGTRVTPPAESERAGELP